MKYQSSNYLEDIGVYVKLGVVVRVFPNGHADGIYLAWDRYPEDS